MSQNTTLCWSGCNLLKRLESKKLKAYGNSKLIVNQNRGEYEVWHEDLVPYQNMTIDMAEKFKNFYMDHVPRQQNAHADALASLAASLALPAWAVEIVVIYSYNFTVPILP